MAVCYLLTLRAEAPVNGYAFGKGIYLADLSSKSANYCVASASGGVGLLLLVEAELSNPMYEISSGDPDAAELARKKNCIATKGMGRTGYTKWKDAGVVHEALKGVKMVSRGLSGPLMHRYLPRWVCELTLCVCAAGRQTRGQRHQEWGFPHVQ